MIVKQYDEGTAARPYGHALVTGIAKYPRKVRTQAQSQRTRAAQRPLARREDARAPPPRGRRP